ncbi:regulatory protein ArsR [Desulfurococcus amylolyticus DSM 16532]|uniref:Regulatory protein ArsR n=1 Tax=Desulfurococcus amylolyticus DSM 16532 TaxID=768672 RepID=I3XPU2_DESAM|nr:regulatory protein ArsR [Desulfurococcus amylolyticus DSM 16532]
MKEAIKRVRELNLCTRPPPIQEADKVLRLPDKDLEGFLNTLRAILEPTRFKILYLLYQSPLPVCVIAYILKQDRTLISHYLTMLKKLGLVKVEQVKRFNIYSLTEYGVTIVNRVLALQQANTKTNEDQYNQL